MDSKAGFIFSVNRDSTDRKAIIDVTNQQVENIAIDWISENIYWTSQKSKVIEVARLNGSYRYVLIHEDLYYPKAIAVDPRVGYLFWTDNGEISKIERSTLDGYDRKVIYEYRKNISLLTDLTIDYSRNKLIWCDKFNSLIFQSNYDGLDVEIIVGSSFKIFQPFTIDIKDDIIYWIEKYALIQNFLKSNSILKNKILI